MEKLLIVSCLIIACGTEPDYRIYGTEVYLEDGVGPTKEQLLTAQDFFIDSMAEYSGKSIEKIKKATQYISVIEWHKDPIKYNGGLYNGLYWGGKIEVVYLGCVYKSAYYHEYIHHMASVFRWTDDVDIKGGKLAELNSILKSTARMIYGCEEEDNERL